MPELPDAGSATLEALQHYQYEMLMVDVDRLLSVAMDLRTMLEALADNSVAVGAWEQGCAVQFGAAQSALVAMHVRYSALVSFRIGRVIAERAAGGGSDAAD
jgi:hypothetical protein